VVARREVVNTITEMYVCVGETDGCEGVIAAETMSGILLPLIASDKTRL
jgi:hypothetical protein